MIFLFFCDLVDLFLCEDLDKHEMKYSLNIHVSLREKQQGAFRLHSLFAQKHEFLYGYTDVDKMLG